MAVESLVSADPHVQRRSMSKRNSKDYPPEMALMRNRHSNTERIKKMMESKLDGALTDKDLIWGWKLQSYDNKRRRSTPWWS